MTVVGMGIGNSGIGKNGNGNRFLSWEWVGMEMGMVLWEWEGMGTEIVLPAHLYTRRTDGRTSYCGNTDPCNSTAQEKTVEIIRRITTVS